jgi:hypothetical protein
VGPRSHNHDLPRFPPSPSRGLSCAWNGQCPGVPEGQFPPAIPTQKDQTVDFDFLEGSVSLDLIADKKAVGCLLAGVLHHGDSRVRISAVNDAGDADRQVRDRHVFTRRLALAIVNLALRN